MDKFSDKDYVIGCAGAYVGQMHHWQAFMKQLKENYSLIQEGKYIMNITWKRA